MNDTASSIKFIDVWDGKTREVAIPTEVRPQLQLYAEFSLNPKDQAQLFLQEQEMGHLRVQRTGSEGRSLSLLWHSGLHVCHHCATPTVGSDNQELDEPSFNRANRVRTRDLTAP